MVKITLGNLLAVTLLAAAGFIALKYTAAFVPMQGYRDLIGSL